MTDKYNALTVILEEDIREDDAEHLIDVIKRFKGVLEVKGNVRDIGDDIAFERARQDLRQKIIDVLWPPKVPK